MGAKQEAAGSINSRRIAREYVLAWMKFTQLLQVIWSELSCGFENVSELG